MIAVIETEEVERLRKENAALHARVAQLELLGIAASSIPAFIVHLGADLRIEWVNDVPSGMTATDVMGRSVLDLVTPPDRAKVVDAIERARSTGKTTRYASRGPGPDGNVAEYEGFISPFGDRGVVLVAFDITEHRRHEEALRTSEEKLRVALAAVHVGLWSWEPQTNEVVWDDGMRALTGYAEPLPVDAYVDRLVHPEDRELVHRGSRRTFETGEYHGELHRIVRPDGEIRWVWPTGRVVLDEQRRIVRIVGGILDVTEQRRVEEQLRTAQKMEALGRLTAGVAHNFNNMLAAILPSLELLRREVPPAEHELVDDALHAGKRAAEMVGQLMTFSGQRPIRSQRTIRPQRLVEGALNICRRTFDRDIVLESEIADDAPAIVGDDGALEQVLVNLLLNARDSVRESGRTAPRIRILVDVVDGVEHPEARAGESYVRIRVEDEGIGVQPEARAHLFEPFFTTKAVDAGTGLGLASSYAIVREHRGFLHFEPREGGGAVFGVFLPRPSAVAPDETVLRSIVERPGRAGRVLLVDDELAVRRVIGRVLESLGYATVAVGDGASAVTLLRGDPAFDVVLLDRSMPGGPGDRFIDDIRSAAPRAKLLFFTGQAVEDAARRRVDGLIAKPVTRTELELQLRRVLGNAK